MSNTVKTLAPVTVGTSPLQIDTVTSNGANNGFSHRKWAHSVSIQADPANSGVVYVGDNLVSTTQYARVLNPGDWFTVEGSAIDPSRIYVLGSASGQIVHPSWN